MSSTLLSFWQSKVSSSSSDNGLSDIRVTKPRAKSMFTSSVSSDTANSIMELPTSKADDSVAEENANSEPSASTLSARLAMFQKKEGSLRPPPPVPARPKQIEEEKPEPLVKQGKSLPPKPPARHSPTNSSSNEQQEPATVVITKKPSLPPPPPQRKPDRLLRQQISQSEQLQKEATIQEHLSSNESKDTQPSVVASIYPSLPSKVNLPTPPTQLEEEPPKKVEQKPILSDRIAKFSKAPLPPLPEKPVHNVDQSLPRRPPPKPAPRIPEPSPSKQESQEQKPKFTPPPKPPLKPSEFKKLQEQKDLQQKKEPSPQIEEKCEKTEPVKVVKELSQKTSVPSTSVTTQSNSTIASRIAALGNIPVNGKTGPPKIAKEAPKTEGRNLPVLPPKPAPRVKSIEKPTVTAPPKHEGSVAEKLAMFQKGSQGIQQPKMLVANPSSQAKDDPEHAVEKHERTEHGRLANLITDKPRIAKRRPKAGLDSDTINLADKHRENMSHIVI